MSQFFDRKTDAFFGSLRHAGYLLLLAGLVLGSSPWWKEGDADQKVQMLAVGTLLFLLGILFRYTHHGFQLDFEKRRLREYLRMFGLRSGKWAPFPAFERVVLSSTLKAAHDHGHLHPGEKPVPPVTWYTIGLYTGTEEPAYELRTDNQADALKTTQLLAERLDIPAEDKAFPLDPFFTKEADR